MVKLEESLHILPSIEQAWNLRQAPLGKLSKSGHHTRRSAEIEEAWHHRLKRNQQVFPHTESFYNQELKDLVYELYKVDFEKYGYVG